MAAGLAVYGEQGGEGGFIWGKREKQNPPVRP